MSQVSSVAFLHALHRCHASCLLKCYAFALTVELSLFEQHEPSHLTQTHLCAVSSAQVCPQFTNVIILRKPVPHVVSLLAEVRYRYNRQLRTLLGVRSWQPPGWNLPWWEEFGPALVGSYATRTLAGRNAFCERADALRESHAAAALDALMGFDVVATLNRPDDIDLTVSALLGWPARKFSSQPAFRVRSMDLQRPTMTDKPGWEDWSLPHNHKLASALPATDGKLSMLSFSATDWPHAPALTSFSNEKEPGSLTAGGETGSLAAVSKAPVMNWWRRGSRPGGGTAGGSLEERWGLPSSLWLHHAKAADLTSKTMPVQRVGMMTLILTPAMMSVLRILRERRVRYMGAHYTVKQIGQHLHRRQGWGKQSWKHRLQ
jgi:hypothetical protein